MSSAGRDALVAMLSRLKGDLAGLNLSRPEVARQSLLTKHPLSGDYLTEVLRLCQRGIESGWLCDLDMHGVRYGRLTPPTKYFPYAIDAMQVVGSSAGHAHEKGEVNLSWSLNGTARFCGLEPGWSVFPPGSRHVHDAKGGPVLVLSFIPQGAVKWEAAKARPAGSSARKGTVLEAAAAKARAAAARRSAAGTEARAEIRPARLGSTARA